MNAAEQTQAVNSRANTRRQIQDMWKRPGTARVIPPKYGSVVVPCSSKLSAIMCAAAVWGCHWHKIHDAEVWAAEPGEQPVPLPEKYR